VGVQNLIMIAAAGLYSYLAVLPLRTSPRTITHWLLSASSFCLGWWTLLAFFTYNADSLEQISILFPVSCLGMFLFFPVNLIFIDLLIPEKKHHYVLYAIVVAIGFTLFTLNFFYPVVFKEIIPLEEGWMFVPNTGSLLTTIWSVFAVYTFVHVLFLLLYWRRNTNLKRERMQINLFFVSGLIALVFVFGEFQLNALLVDVRPSTLSPVLLSPWIIGMVYAVRKYRFLNLTPEMVTRDILQATNELIILVNMRGEVTYMNKKALQFFNRPFNHLAGTPAHRLLGNDPLEWNLPVSKENPDLRKTMFTIALKDSESTIIPLEMTATKLNDQFGDPLGILLTAKEQCSLDFLSNDHNLTAREIDIIRGLLNGSKTENIANELQITKRTVTTHITHIYNKMGVTNRVELLNRLKED
jgi:DNA-binding CsgD family transcriptional regulator/PAS domain-containing protein